MPEKNGIGIADFAWTVTVTNPLSVFTVTRAPSGDNRCAAFFFLVVASMV